MTDISYIKLQGGRFDDLRSARKELYKLWGVAPNSDCSFICI